MEQNRSKPRRKLEPVWSPFNIAAISIAGLAVLSFFLPLFSFPNMTANYFTYLIRWFDGTHKFNLVIAISLSVGLLLALAMLGLSFFKGRFSVIAAVAAILVITFALYYVYLRGVEFSGELLLETTKHFGWGYSLFLVFSLLHIPVKLFAHSMQK